MGKPKAKNLNEFPLHLQLPEGVDTHGCVACEQVRAYNLDARSAERIESVPDEFIRKVTSCIRSFF